MAPPVPGVAGPPLADPFGVGGPLEVVLVGGLLQPEGLAMPLAGLSTGRSRTEALSSLIARVRFEQRIAMQALG